VGWSFFAVSSPLTFGTSLSCVGVWFVLLLLLVGFFFLVTCFGVVGLGLLFMSWMVGEFFVRFACGGLGFLLARLFLLYNCPGGGWSGR